MDGVNFIGALNSDSDLSELNSIDDPEFLQSENKDESDSESEADTPGEQQAIIMISILLMIILDLWK